MFNMSRDKHGHLVPQGSSTFEKRLAWHGFHHPCCVCFVSFSASVGGGILVVTFFLEDGLFLSPYMDKFCSGYTWYPPP